MDIVIGSGTGCDHQGGVSSSRKIFSGEKSGFSSCPAGRKDEEEEGEVIFLRLASGAGFWVFRNLLRVPIVGGCAGEVVTQSGRKALDSGPRVPRVFWS